MYGIKRISVTIRKFLRFVEFFKNFFLISIKLISSKFIKITNNVIAIMKAKVLSYQLFMNRLYNQKNEMSIIQPNNLIIKKIKK